MNDMLVEPAAGVEERQTQTRKVPWLERQSRGLLKAWLRTVGMSLVSPGELMNALPPAAPLRPAFWFMLVTQTLVWTVAALPFWAVIGLQLVSMARGGGGPQLVAIAGTLLGIFVFGVLFSLLVWLVFSLAAHAVLAFTGPRAAGLGRTMQAFAYASGANVLTAIPCLGSYFGWIWWVVSATIMVKHAQKVSGSRAALAVIGPVAAAILLLVGGYAYFMYSVVSSARGGWALVTTAHQASTAAQTTSIAAGMVSYSTLNGSWPDHAAQLVADGQVPSAMFVGGPVAWSATFPSNVNVGAQTLDVFDAQAPGARRAAAAALTLPPAAVAHRVGDMVICVTPRDSVQIPPSIWLVIAWPDPSIAGNPPPLTCHVAGIDGRAVMIPATQFDADLAAQNDLRAQHGLPPLPHPKDVR
jgi:hypothetical protein